MTLPEQSRAQSLAVIALVLLAIAVAALAVRGVGTSTSATITIECPHGQHEATHVSNQRFTIECVPGRRRP